MGKNKKKKNSIDTAMIFFYGKKNVSGYFHPIFFF